MLLIHKFTEFDRTCQQGINWIWDRCSQPMIVIRLFRLRIMLRRRGPEIESKPKWIFNVDLKPLPNLSILPWKNFDLL